MSNFGFNQTFNFAQSYGFGNGFSYQENQAALRGPVLFFDAGNPTSYPGAGTTWTDLISGVPATLQGGYAYHSGRVDFNGTDGFATTPSDVTVDLTEGFTMEVYVKFRDLAVQQGIVVFNSPGYMNLIYTSGGEIRWEVAAGEQVFDPGPIETGVWYHLVGTWDRASGLSKLYRDGVLVASDTKTCSVTTRTSYLQIGQYDGDSSFTDGDIAVVRLYDRPITATEVTNSYNSLNTRYAGPLVYLDAAIPASYPGSGSTWSDLGLWHNDATLLNSPAYSSANSGTILFDADSTQAATVPDLGDLTRWTVETWVKFSDVTNISSLGVITNNYGGNDVNFSIGNNDTSEIAGGLYKNVMGGGWQNAPNTLTPVTDTWYHLAATYDGSDVKFYINGASSGSTAWSSVSLTSGGDVNIGRRWDGYNDATSYVSGSIPFVKIYDRALSSVDVSGSYESLKSRYPLPPVSLPTPYFRWDPANYDAGIIPDTGAYAGLIGAPGNAAHLVNGPTVSASPPRVTYGGDMSGQYAYTSALMSPGMNTFTVAAWVKTPWTDRKIIGFENNQVGQGSSGYDRHMFVQDTTGLLGFGVFDTMQRTVLSTTPVNDGVWHHCVASCIFDPNTQATGTGTVKIYVDGNLEGTITASPYQYEGAYWRIASWVGWGGGLFDSGYFLGDIGKVEVYGEFAALTDAQVQQLWLNDKATYGL